MQVCAQTEGQIEELLAQQQQLLARREQLEQQLSADRRAPRADWQGSFPWDVEVQSTAEAVFGITSFRCLSPSHGCWHGIGILQRNNLPPDTAQGFKHQRCCIFCCLAQAISCQQSPPGAIAFGRCALPAVYLV